jgi:hypothetical protein
MTWVYLAGVDHVKGVPERHTLIVNPFAHVGQKNVPASWAEKDSDGHLVGKTFMIVFERGRYDADAPMARYLIENGYATVTPWVPPQNDAADPLWRWRPDAA